MDTKDNDSTIDTQFSVIDQAIAQAKARKAAKAGLSGAAQSTATTTTTEPKAPRASKVSAEERARLAAQKLADKLARQAIRSQERAARKAAKATSRSPAHMSKVAKAAAKLPELSPAAELELSSITANFSRAQVAAIAAHLSHFNRVQATTRSLSAKLTAGDAVVIVSGDPRFVGQTGTVVKSQRIRCYVAVAGQAKPLYLFASDVEAQSVSAAAAV